MAMLSFHTNNAHRRHRKKYKRISSLIISLQNSYPLFILQNVLHYDSRISSSYSPNSGSQLSLCYFHTALFPSKEARTFQECLGYFDPYLFWCFSKEIQFQTSSFSAPLASRSLQRTFRSPQVRSRNSKAQDRSRSSIQYDF